MAYSNCQCKNPDTYIKKLEGAFPQVFCKKCELRCVQEGIPQVR